MSYRSSKNHCYRAELHQDISGKSIPARSARRLCSLSRRVRAATSVSITTSWASRLPAAAICAGSGIPPTTSETLASVASGVSYWLVIAISDAPAEDAASAMESVDDVRPVELTTMMTSPDRVDEQQSSLINNPDTDGYHTRRPQTKDRISGNRRRGPAPNANTACALD